MEKYNASFFNLYENTFKVLKSEYGEQHALVLFRKIMELGLKTAYDKFEFHKGDPQSFTDTLTARDNAVGLLVKFPEVSSTKIVYQFYTDPFPNLKNIVPHNLLDDTYINFKIKYLLGDSWSYTTTKHFWNGDDCNEFTIVRLHVCR